MRDGGIPQSGRRVGRCSLTAPRIVETARSRALCLGLSIWVLGAVVAASAVDSSTLEGQVVCGYQGWFRAEGDGTGLGWVHYGQGERFRPGHCTFDVWPDLTGFGASERFSTPFRFADGRVAELFSSVHPDTVRRHFRWMREYGISGAFVQRFGTVILSERDRAVANRVLRSCVESAVAEGRTLTVMYDLTNLPPERFGVIREDWASIRATGWFANACSQRQAGKPLVALYGPGFADQPEALSEWNELVSSMRQSGASVMLGVPTHWREGTGDARSNKAFHAILRQADVISPWTVGRMARSVDVESVAEHVWQKDLEWCQKEGKFYLPVVFPGFSWHNLSRERAVDSPVDVIPRQRGRFFWKQVVEAVRVGAKGLYVAMFDEVDEGTAIMKCSPERPTGESPFLDVSDVPSDHYLWLSGQAGRLIRSEISGGGELPAR